MPIYVNKVEITDDEVFREMQFHPSSTREEARDEAAKALLIRELLRQEAIKAGLIEEGADTDTIDSALMQLTEAAVTAPEADSRACRHYYDNNLERFAISKGAITPMAFEQAEPRIRDYLHTRSVRHGIQAYILDLAGKARISGFDLAATL